MFGTHFNIMGSVKFIKFTINFLTLPFNFYEEIIGELRLSNNIKTHLFVKP